MLLCVENCTLHEAIPAERFAIALPSSLKANCLQQHLRYGIPISPKMVHPISPKRTACSSASLSPSHIHKTVSQERSLYLINMINLKHLGYFVTIVLNQSQKKNLTELHPIILIYQLLIYELSQSRIIQFHQLADLFVV